MIDHLMAFADEATAQADQVVGAYWHSDGQDGGSWNLSCCFPGLFVWAPAQDVTSGDPPVTTHTPYDSQWRICIVLPTQDAALSASAAVELVWDASANVVLQATLTSEQLSALMIQPVPEGHMPPFGNVP